MMANMLQYCFIAYITWPMKHGLFFHPVNKISSISAEVVSIIHKNIET